MGKNISNQVVETLAGAGIRNIYAITGDSLNEINSAVRQDGRIKWIHMRHEESGAFAAGAEAQLTGRVACCAGSSGPGHVHLVNGLYDCNRSYAPVLAIATTCASSQFGTQYFQETNTDKLFADCSVYNQLATSSTEVQRMLHGAMQAAIEDGGVGVVGLPGDTAQEPISPVVGTLPPLETPVRPAADPAQVKEAADLLNGASKVTLYCGCGIADCHPQVMEMAAKLNAPVVATLKGKDCVLYDCPNGVGNGGGIGLKSARDAVLNCEVLVLLGNDYPFTHWLPGPDSPVKAIQVDLRADHLGRRARVDIGVCADCGAFADAILPQIRQKTDRTFLDASLASYDKCLQDLAEGVANHGKVNEISPLYLTSLLDKYASEDAVFTVDTGLNVMWAAQLITANGHRRIIGSFNHGSMANAMPQTIGAALACPNRQVIGMCGDGGITMLLGDLATIAQYNLPVKLVVYDNRMLGFVQMEMVNAHIPVWQTNMVNPDFGRLATDMGFLGVTVSDPALLEDAVKRVLAHPGPALLSVFTTQQVP